MAMGARRDKHAPIPNLLYSQISHAEPQQVHFSYNPANPKLAA